MNAPMRSQESRLYQSVRNYYSTPQAVRTYTDYAREQGLHTVEQAMVERFMRPPAEVLDIGCGAGREAFALSRMGYAVVGVDVSPELIEQGRKLASEVGLHVDLRICDGRRLEFPDQSFDYVLLITQMIHHVPLRANRVALLREARRVLRTGGKILLTYHDWEVVRTHEPWGCGGAVTDRAQQMVASYEILEPGDTFATDCQGVPTDAYGYSHNFIRAEMEAEVTAAGLTILDRADFYSITGRPEEFWKPTQVLVLS